MSGFRRVRLSTGLLSGSQKAAFAPGGMVDLQHFLRTREALRIVASGDDWIEVLVPKPGHGTRTVVDGRIEVRSNPDPAQA